MNNLLLKVLLRNILKKKFLTSVQIGGLIIGFSIFIFLLVKINYEYSYDNFWKASQSIYRLGLNLKYEDGRVINSAKNFHGSSELLEAEVPGVAAHCNMAPDVITVFYQEKTMQDVNWFWSDTTFFDVFERKFIYKATDHILDDIHGIAISESFAKKLFGSENPLNKEISLNEGWKFLIKGVYEDIPANSHLKIDVIGSYRSLSYYMRNFDNRLQVLIENPNYVSQRTSPYNSDRWSIPMQYRPYCYIRLAQNSSIDRIKSAVQPAMQKVGLPPDLEKSKIDFIFQPITSIHLHSSLDNELMTNGSNLQVNFLIIIGMVVIIVCFVNFLNLSTISTIEDRKSYTIKILNGSPKVNVFKDLLFRNIILYLIALLIAFPIAMLIVRSQLPEGAISNSVILIMLAISGTGICIASIIPYISIFNTPIFLSLKGQSQRQKQNWSGRKALVVAQFAITIILVISTIGIYKQMNYVMEKKLGFSGSRTVYSYTPMTMTNSPDIPGKLLAFKNEVLALPGVNSFSVSSSVPGKEVRRVRENITPGNSAEPFGSPFSEISIDDNFLKTYEIQLISGTNFNEQSDWTSDEVLINRCASEAMHFKSPEDAIGSSFLIGENNFKVKGVLENYHHVSLHQPIKPAIFFQDLQWELSVGFYSFQLGTSDITGVMKNVGKIWKKLYPKDEFVYYLSDKKFEAQYISDINFNHILTYSALLAMVISCLGLLSLAMFNTKQRIKEIGIRKVNGAKVSEILAALNIDFMKWVAIAFVIAMPIAYYAMHKWLENFAYKTELSWWIFVLAGVLALGIALLTVTWQSWKAATRNPIEALRYE